MNDQLHNRHPRTALVLSGGGARGAYQVGVLKAIAEEIPAGTNPFEIITGVSVGAINASYLASRAEDMKAGIEGLCKLWLSLEPGDIYETKLWPLLRDIGKWSLALPLGWAGFKPPPSIFDNTPLRRLINREVDFKQLQKILDSDVIESLAITASSYARSQSVSFYYGSVPVVPWHRSRRDGIPSVITDHHVLASSALPLVFPAEKMNGTWFGDGALRQLAPLSPAVHLGADKIFVVGARSLKMGTEDLDWTWPDDGSDHVYPNVGFLGGQLLDIVFNDNLEADVERLLRVNKILDSAEGDINMDLKSIDIEMISPSQDVRPFAGKHAHRLPLTIRTMLKSIGAMKAPWVVPSYLLFQRDYVCDLIDMGYADARKDIERILAIVDPQGKAKKSS